MKFGKTFKLLFTAIAACCIAAFCSCGNTAVPPEIPPVEPVPDTSLKQVDIYEFLAGVYNANFPNFTVNVDVTSNEKAEKEIEIVYDAKTGYSYRDGETERIYRNGKLYEKKSDGRYTVTDSTAFFEFRTIVKRKLADLIEFFCDKIGVTGTVEINGRTYECGFSRDLTESTRALLSIARKNAKNPVISAVAEAVNYFRGSSFSEEETAAMIVMYGDSTLKQLLETGKPLSREEARILYNVVRGAVNGSYDVPTFDEFVLKYGGETLCDLLGKRSAAELVEIWKVVTLEEALKDYSVLSDLISDGNTAEVTDAKMSARAVTDGDFTLKSVLIETSVSLSGIEYKKTVECTFPDIGTSTVKSVV